MLLLQAIQAVGQGSGGRILDTFPGEIRAHEPFLETETMIVNAKTHFIDQPGRQRTEWLKVMFRDKDGGNYSERILPAGLGAGSSFMRCRAQGNDILLPSGGYMYFVNRDPSVPVASRSILEDNLCAITDRYLILRTLVAQDNDGINFRDRHTGAQVGRVQTSLRVQQLEFRENDIIFTSRDAKGRFRLHRMNHPDFSAGPVVKMKISPMPGVYGSIDFFGKNFAVVSNLKGSRSILRYTDPAKKGKPGVYPMNIGAVYGEWFECDGTLAQWVPYPTPGLFHAVFADKAVSLVPAGLPAGFLGSHFVSAGEESFYVTGPTLYPGFQKPGDWVHRLDFAPGRSLMIDSPVADERDGILRFTARLDRAAAQAVSFDYATMAGSAGAGDDFTPIAGTATIPAGETQVAIDVPLIEDFTIERPESLELHVTGVQGAFCDSARVVGRIRGSGARVIEEVADDTSGVVVGTLDGNGSRTGSANAITVGGREVEARPLGFEGFWPVSDSGDGYRYARAIPLGSDRMKLCQFDAANGDLLEEFDHSAFLCQDGELVLAKGLGYVRYAFFDGFPVLSLDNFKPVEGGGEQTFTVASERTHRDLDFAAEWNDPAREAGEISFELKADGDIEFRITPLDDRRAGLGLPLGIRVTTTEAGNPVPANMIAGVTIADNDVAATAFVPAETFRPLAIAAGGERLWLARTGGAMLESFDFSGGTLVPGPKATLPKGVRLVSNNFHGFGAGQALSFDGSRLLVSADKVTGPGLLTLAGAGGAKPKGRFFTTQLQGTSQVAAAGLSVSSNTIPLPGTHCAVQVRDVKNRLLAELRPNALQGTSFGYSMALVGDMLWIASPKTSGSGGGGRVDGFQLPGFVPRRTLLSPDPVEGGTFGYAIAAHGPYLVIGEPSNTAPGAAWVFSADGTSMLKRLDSGEEGLDGFGCQVATRNGRILIGAGRIEGNFGSVAPAAPAHRPVLLWEDPDANPLRLVPSTADAPGYESGHRIALLDDCAVIAAGTETSGGLEFVALPVARTAAVAPSIAGAEPVVPGWPAEDAPAPRWSLRRSAGDGIEVIAALGGIPERPEQVLLEWSPDLVNWEPLVDAAGTILKPAKVSSFTSAGGTLSLHVTTGSGTSCYFRLRSTGADPLR